MMIPQQGLASLPPQQGMAPGQAAPQQVTPKPNPATPEAEVRQYEGMSLPQLITLFQQRPSGVLLGKIDKLAESLALQKSAEGQRAMLAAQQMQGPSLKDQVMSKAAQAMQPMPATEGGIMQGYAHGGAVAFQTGGYAPDYQDARRFGIDLSPYDSPEVRAQKLERVKKMREFEAQMAGRRAEIPTEAGLAATEAASETQRLKARPTGIMGQIPPPTAPQRAPRPGTGRPAAAPTAAPASAMGIATPAKPDNWADIESQGLKGIAALQDVYRKQGEVDPELARLRTAAYESAQGIAQRRERDRLAALTAAEKAASAPLMDNQEALLRLAGSIGGKMRFGEALGAMAGTAGGIRGEQRKALETAQRESRLEQNAIDQLNQALAEKRVADRSGDVDRMRAADTKVAEAQLKVTELRTTIGKERSLEADRAEQRALTKRGQDVQLQAARIAAAAREGAAADPRKVFDTLMDNVRAEYDKWVKTPEGARSSLKPELARAKQTELLEQQVRLAQAAGVQGLGPLLAAVKQGGTSGTAAPAGWGKATEVK